MNIKEDKADNKMRSFQLKDLQSVFMNGLPTTTAAEAEPEQK